MEAALAGARIGDPVEHSHALMGFIAGAAIGLGVGIALLGATLAAPFTGGLSLVAVAGGIAALGGITALTGLGAMAGGKVLGLAGTYNAGQIITGSPNVFVNGRQAARAITDTAACSQHGGPPPIAQGSRTVGINSFPAARKDDKLQCDATISDGSPDVMIGGGQADYLAISPEIPAWMSKTAQWMAVIGGAVALGFGGLAAFLSCGLAGLAAFAGDVAIGALDSLAGKLGGGAIGQALWGDKGREIGETLGELTGVRGPLNALRTTRAHPVDVATGELLVDQTDFTLPGPMPLVWTRNWSSRSSHIGDLGSGWSHPFDMALEPLPQHGLAQLRLADGRLTFLPLALPGHPSLNTAERLILHREEGAWRLADYLGTNWWFPDRALGVAPLARVSDAAGNAIDLQRDASGALVGIVDSGGRRLVIGHDPAGRIVSIDAPHPDLPRETMRLVSYAYNELGDLVTVTDARGGMTAYRSEGRLIVEERRRGGIVFAFRWDDPALGRDARVVESWGTDNLYHCRFDYSPTDKLTLVTDDRGAETLYGYNRLDLVVYERDPLGHERHWQWSEAGALLSYRDGEGRRSQFGYDDVGRLISRGEPGGAVTTIGYKPIENETSLSAPDFGLPQWVSLPQGGTQAFVYDGRGRLTASTDALGREQRFLRDERGLPLAVSDGLGVVARYGWDGQGLLAWEGDGAGNRTDYGYDALGRVTQIRRSGEETRYRYDPAGNPVAIIRASDEATVALEYNAEDRVIAHRDPRGRVTRWDYAGLPFPVQRVAADGSSISYAYDRTLNLVGMTNEKGERLSFDIDAAGRTVRETGFDGRVQEYRHDASGLLIERRDGAGTTRYLRGEDGRIRVASFPDKQVHRFSWSAAGWLVAATSPDRQLSFAYDAAGQLVGETQDEASLLHRYDARGRRIATELPDGRTVASGYDAGDRFTAVTLDGRPIARVARDREGREVEREAGALRMVSDYDPAGRLVRQHGATVRGGGGATIDRRYHYDPFGQLLAMTDAARGEKRFRYDALDRLVGVDGASPEAFVADPAGNVLPAGGVGGEAIGDRLRVWGDRRFDYDADGRRVRELIGAGEGRERRYRWDGAGRLSEVVERSRRGTRITRFGYDALGRRAWKDAAALPPPAANSEAAGDLEPRFTRTRFLWDGDVLLGEASAPADATPADLLETLYLHEPGSFRPLALVRRAGGGAAEVHHYQLDRVGTPQELVNDNGEVTWRGELTAWGALARVAGAGVANPIRFQGQYEDAETGLCYNRHRYYDPAVARYTAPDPIGLEGGTNGHAYVPDPLGWVDPLGLEPCAFVDAQGELNLRNKFPQGSAEDLALQQHVRDWNNQIAANGGTMTRQTVTPAMRRSATRAATAARTQNPAAYQGTGMAAGHTPDVAWGGATQGPIIPLNETVNGYVGGATQAVPSGTSYGKVKLF